MTATAEEGASPVWERALAPAGIAAVGLAVVAAFGICSLEIVDPDYWTHLALGRAYREAGTVFIPEPYVLDGATGPAPSGVLGRVLSAWSGGEWPFQVALEALRRAAGDTGVSLAMATLAAVAAVLLGRPLMRERRVGRLALGVALVTAAFYAARFRFTPRPEAAAAPLLALVLCLAYRWGEAPRWRTLFAVGAVLVAWRPLHVTWALGAGFAGVAMGLRPRLDFWRAQPVAARIAAAIAAAVAAAGALGFAGFVLSGLRPGGILAGVTEMRPTWEFPSLGWPFAVVAIAGIALAWGEPEGRAPRIGVWAVAAILGTVVVRNVGFAALAMLPGALAGLTASNAAPQPPRERVALAIAAVAGILVARAVASDRDYPFGYGVDWRWFPREAAEWVRASPAESPVFNSWGWGGYLAWAWNGRPRTFVDGRLGSSERLAEHDAITSGVGEDVLARRGFRTVFLQPLFQNSGRLAPALGVLLSDPRWRLVHASDGVVFAATPLPPGLSAAPEERAWRAVLRQADVVAAQNEPAPHVEFSRAIALLRLGDARAARDAYLSGRRTAPDVAASYSGLGDVLGVR